MYDYETRSIEPYLVNTGDPQWVVNRYHHQCSQCHGDSTTKVIKAVSYPIKVDLRRIAQNTNP